MNVFKIEKVSNMVFITSECGTIWQSWDESEITERKINNAMKRIQKRFLDPIKFVREF